MKVLFVYSLDDIQSTSKPLRSWASVQFGISYISSVLKAQGHETHLLVLGSNRWRASARLVESSMEQLDPDLVCFTAVASQYPFIERIARFTKNRWPDKHLMIGGAHATLNPEQVITGPFDVLCIGEGEYPTAELCRQLVNTNAPHSIPNLWIKSPDGNIEKTPPRQFLQDLDGLPFPDRMMWRPWIQEHVHHELAVLLGRGCPYNCTYCSNHVLKKVASGKYVRMRSPENILKELASLRETHPLHNRIFFEVEAITLDKTWMFELCNQLEVFNSTTDNSFSYGCNFRISPQSVDEKLFVFFKKANFYKLYIGLESGSKRIRREVLNRNYTNKDFLDVTAWARRYGLKIYLFNMIGLPGETFDDYMETVSLNRQCQPDGHFTSIFFPYPGTQLYNTCVKQGLIKDPIDTQMERRQAVIDLPNFSKAQIQRAYTWFHYRVYKGYKSLWRILVETTIIKMRSNPTTNFLFLTIVQWPIIRYVYAKLAGD